MTYKTSLLTYVLISVHFGVHSQECERLVSLPASQPILRTCSSADYLNCSLASTGNIATGKIYIQLDSFSNGQQGTYTFMAPGGAKVLKCITLYLIGTPNYPGISANRVPHTGQTVTLTCQCISTTDPSGHGLAMTFAWTKDGVTLTSGGRFTLLAHTPAALTITNVQRNDELSQFTCTASEEMGLTSNSSAAFKISIYYGPDSIAFNRTSVTQILDEGDRFFPVECLADCKPSCTFRWTKGQIPVSNSAVLDLGIAGSDDLGQYTCTSEHSNYTTFTGTKNYSVILIHGPDKVPLSPPSTTYTEMESAILANISCSAVCYPECFYTWSKVGTAGTVQNNAVLSLGQLTWQKSGSYICSATNPRTSSTRNGPTVIVEVQYSARRIPGEEVQLIFNTRKHNNATLVYKIVAYPVPKPSQFVWKRCMNISSCEPLPPDLDKFEIDTEGLSSNLSILDVQNEDYRIYQLSVSNGVGDALVEWLHLRPIELPDSPTVFHVIQNTIKQTTAVVTWITGFDGGSPQTFHLSYRKLVGDTGFTTATVQHDDKKVLNYTIEHLEPGTKYFVSLFAANEEGSTASINVTFQTLKTISDHTETSPNIGPVIGGSIGGTIGAIMAIVVVVVIVKRKYSLNCICFRTKKSADPAEQSVSGRHNPGCNIVQSYEELPMTIQTSDYDALKKGDNGPNSSHVYTTLDESSSKAPVNYGNATKGEPVYNNTVQQNPVQTVL
ncbi:nephrin-like isoform X3 [Mya arenaria]|uniref:nephrin-like isoform X3 n=1 Tax=Mya arenaria TaxID=6604 RepID=UPI0022E64BC0|nr:nephrin-like isoform X3 [Mya arenaria]